MAIAKMPSDNVIRRSGRAGEGLPLLTRFTLAPRPRPTANCSDCGHAVPRPGRLCAVRSVNLPGRRFTLRGGGGGRRT
ncbi:hypothetical protein GCM10010342_32910 [Streptomyces anulatus]|nr:hypothetical protein GCM10010342_32910 [Streptomyces anulatus]